MPTKVPIGEICHGKDEKHSQCFRPEENIFVGFSQVRTWISSGGQMQETDASSSLTLSPETENMIHSTLRASVPKVWSICASICARLVVSGRQCSPSTFNPSHRYVLPESNQISLVDISPHFPIACRIFSSCDDGDEIQYGQCMI